MNMDLRNSETVVVLRGCVVEEYYDDAGVLVESFVLGDCHVADASRNDVPPVRYTENGCQSAAVYFCPGSRGGIAFAGADDGTLC